MKEFVEVAVFLPVRETFHYRLPKPLRERAAIGSRVRVPFGHRDVEGVIVGRPARPEVSRVKLIRALLDEKPVFRPDLLELGRWIAQLYQTSWGEALAAMLPAPIRRSRKSRSTPLEEALVEPTYPLTLTPDQAKAFESVRQALAAGRHQVFLLYGITGSGKTEIYLQAIHRVLAAGRSAIVLVPEISLTPQAIERFRGRFGAAEVAVLHSALSDAQRASEWRKIHAGQARLVIGARSAVFAPVSSLGLIVVDEEHEPSYKQEDAPRYHAREVALERARLSSAVVLLGSATPSLESFSRAQSAEVPPGVSPYHLLELPSRIDHAPLAEVQIVDLRQEMFHGRASRIFSADLERALKRTLETRQQAILFLNRRGFSTFVHCRRCGYVLRCDLCRLPLIYHLALKMLVCHTCSQNLSAPELCPTCRSGYVRFQGTGTERVESELARLFPQASIARMDSDATRIRGAHAQILNAFSDHQIDFLIGTQMIAKGLDVPRVTLVGVISADTSLNRPDFRSAERTFNLLTQVAGRAGRGSLPGKVIIQTYTPHHYAILAAQKQDYRAFYQQEIQIRKELALPPFTCLVQLTVRAMREEKTIQFAERLSRACREQLPSQVQLFGPAPSPIPKLRRFFRWQILLKSSTLDPITAGLPSILKPLHPPRGCYLAVNVDPL